MIKLKKGERIYHRLHGYGKFIEYYEGKLVIIFDESPKKERVIRVESKDDLYKVDKEGRKIKTLEDKFEIQCKECCSRNLEFAKVRKGIIIKCSDCGNEEII